MSRNQDEEFPSLITPGVDLILNPGDHICFRTAEGAAEIAKALQKRIHGQLSVEHDEFPDGVQLFFCSYPDGDFYEWHVEALHFVLIAKVDGRAKALAIIPMQAQLEFQKQVNNVANHLNIKHGYPVEYPEEFEPQGENPEDKRND